MSIFAGNAANPRRRAFLAFAIAPWAGGVVAVVWSFLGIVATHNTDYADCAIAFPLGVVFGYIAMTVLGIPAHLALRRLGWVSLWVYLAVGFAAGTAIYALTPGADVLYDLLSPEYSIASFQYPVILLLAASEGGAIGIVCAAIFWLIARPH